MKATELLRRLAAGETVSLAAWYGDPLSRRDAESWLATMREKRHGGWSQPSQRFGSRLAEMIARYWSGQDAVMSYDNLSATAEMPADRAQLELCYGQLLLARKLQPAWQHLDAGFGAAACLFEPGEYFVVLKRHESLRQLPLSSVASDGAGLDALLKEAGVIKQLRGRRSGCTGINHRHRDTID